MIVAEVSDQRVRAAGVRYSRAAACRPSSVALAARKPSTTVSGSAPGGGPELGKSLGTPVLIACTVWGEDVVGTPVHAAVRSATARTGTTARLIRRPRRCRPDATAVASAGACAPPAAAA